jgi:hypothetical protein
MSRRKRKRDRQSGPATGTVPDPRGDRSPRSDTSNLPRGSGGRFGGLWSDASASDLVLLRHAIHAGWPIPAERRGPIIEEVYTLFETVRRARNPRKLIGAARVFLEAAYANLRRPRTPRRSAGRPARPEYRPEECRTLDATECARAVGIGEGATEGVAHVSYTVGNEQVAYPLQMVAVRNRGGTGARWRFICPLAVNGVACNRRVPQLYLPPGARYFGCPRCQRVREGRRQR